MPKNLVENCAKLSISEVMREKGVTSRDHHEHGRGFYWRIQLFDRDGDAYSQDIYFCEATMYLGGHRIYFLCDCGRRASNLYLPSDGRYYLCRHCYDLVYASQTRKGTLLYEMIDKYKYKLQNLEKKLKRKGIRRLTRLKLEKEFSRMMDKLDSNINVCKARVDRMGIKELLTNCILEVV